VARRRANGEGTVFPRKDGRYEAAAYFLTTSGVRKRIRVYAKTRAEAHAKLVEAKAQAQQGIRVPDRVPRLGAYLDYWLADVVRPNRRATTFERYEGTVRLHLKPALGHQRLTQLTVPLVQAFLSQRLKDGHSIRNVQIMREVLRSALSRAMREELITRNIATLLELPKYEGREITPWTVEEARRFLLAAVGDPLHAAFLLAVLYGLRRGEVLGLRWCDVDFGGSILRIRQQVQRVGGELRQTPLKTRMSRRDLPLIEGLRVALSAQRELTSTGHSGLVFATKTGQPIEPRNYTRSFKRICEKAAVRAIRVHDMRHTAATLLKQAGVPARDAQLILGHSTVIITQEIYQHDDLDSRHKSLERVERLFLRAPARPRCRQEQPSASQIVEHFTSIESGRGDRIRTCDLRFWRSISGPDQNRAQSVRAVMEARTRLWLMGLVAVSVAVKKSTVPPDSEEAPCSVE
jgi:integrase